MGLSFVTNNEFSQAMFYGLQNFFSSKMSSISSKIYKKKRIYVSGKLRLVYEYKRTPENDDILKF